MATSPCQKLRSALIHGATSVAFCLAMALALCCAGFAQVQTTGLQLQPVSESVPPSQPVLNLVTPAEVQPEVQFQPGDAEFVPLTPQQRADMFFKGYLLSPTSYAEAAATASAALVFNEPDAWHRTFAGYGKRASSTFAINTMEEAIHDAGDGVLELDPRYFPCRCTGVFHRAGHALKMSFFAYDDSGYLRLDLPQIVGAYGASMVANSWYPGKYSPLVQGVQQGHLQISFEAGVNLVREFSPELKHLFHIKQP